TLAEHPREVCLHEAVIVDGCRAHLLPSAVRKSGRVRLVDCLLRFSLARPVAAILSCRLAEDTVRFCDSQSESATGWCSVFTVASPGRWRRSGQFPERPSKMY